MQQLDPRAVWLMFISLLLRWIPLFVFLLIGNTVLAMQFAELGIQIGFVFIATWFWGIVLLLFSALFAWAKLSYHFYRYELTEDGFQKELGVIWKKYVTIPYDRIQNVDIHRGIIARLLGLSDLNIQTAGSAAQIYRNSTFGLGAEGRLPGLSKKDAERLRDELISRAKK